MSTRPNNGSRDEGLIRAVGLPEIVALTINGIIGAGIFAVPSHMSRILGPASPVAFIIAGLFTTIIVLCFAELGSRYDRTGGAYLYAAEALGGAPAFIVGWMYLLARLTSSAALSNAMADFIGYFAPVVTPWRQVLVGCILIVLGLINYFGIRLGTRLINFFTVTKLLPIFVFIIAGFMLVPGSFTAGLEMPSPRPLSQALLVAIFVFSGFEIVPVPGAEIKNPRRNLPLGVLIGTGITIVIYVLIQIVAVAAHPNLGASKSPLAESAQRFLGSEGGTLLTAGAVCSTIGTLISLLLVAPRILYAMSLNHQMPALFSRIHSKYVTPHLAIFFTIAVVVPLAVSGTFTGLATLSAMARLVTYIGSAIALIILRRRQPMKDVFRIPGGFLVPFLTIVLSIYLLTAATSQQWIAGSIAVAVGLVLYLIATFGKRESSSASPQ